jgi:lipoprotein-anchoring transpeptidase ErfK/SrfK
MLLVLLATALSASVRLPADSVRLAAKGTARADTTIVTLPAPTIASPPQPAPEVVLPIRPVTSIASPMARPDLVPVADAERRPAVVQQASATVAPAPTLVAAAPTPVAVSVSAATTPSKDSAAPAPERPAESAPIKPPVVAPADAVATAAAKARPAESTTRIDPRTVVSVRSSERFEPLYAVPIPSAGVRLGAPTAADSIVVYKRERTLVLFNRGIPIRSYFVALGSKPVGDKERVGDQKTPEGLFHVNAHNPASKFHLALRISYPDDAHRARAAALGVDPGGDIMIHGLPKEYSEAGKNHLKNDWTNGCVALSNQEIEEIWHAVPDGTPVQIKP